MRRTPPICVLVAALAAFAFTAFGARALMQGQAPPVSPATQTPGATPAQAAVPEATASVTGQVVGGEHRRARQARPRDGGWAAPRPRARKARKRARPCALATLTSGASGPPLPPGMVRRETETSETGRFEFAGLPAGRLGDSHASPGRVSVSDAADR